MVWIHYAMGGPWMINNKWLSDSLKEEGFSTKENLEKGFEKFFKKLSSFEQKRMQHKDSDIGQGR